MSQCPKCGCSANAHFMRCPRVGGPVSFSFDKLFAQDTRKENMIHLIVIDTETGGLDPDRHCIIELAAWHVTVTPEGATPVGEPFHAFITPDRPVDPGAAAVNGYNESEWDEIAIPRSEAFQGFLHWLDAIEHEDLTWAGSNVLGFDLPFLRGDMARISMELPGKPKFGRRTVNTESLCFPVLVEGKTDSCGVAALRNWAGCKGDQQHNALDDVADTVRIIDCYFERYVAPLSRLEKWAKDWMNWTQEDHVE